MSRKNRNRLLLAAAVWLLAPGPRQAAAAPPEGVSPGAATAAVPPRIGTACPTFSWTQPRGDGPIRLAVFELGAATTETAGAGNPKPVLDVLLPAGSTSWTPPAERCLERQRIFAWAVRGSAGEWSEPLLFRIAAQPSLAEVRAAAGLLKRTTQSQSTAAAQPWTPAAAHRADSPGEPGPTRASTAPLLPVAAETGISVQPTETTGSVAAVHALSDSTGSGSAALVGDSRALSGKVFGIRGLSASSGGAAAAFENTAGGTLLAGYGNGTLVFQVTGDGTVIANTLIGHGGGITDVGDLVCPGDGIASFGCVTGSSEIEAGAISENDLQENSVTADEIQEDAVGSSEIKNGSVTADELAVGSVGASEIATNAVGSSEIEDLSVRSSDIADGSVGNSELAAESVKNEALDGTEAGHFLYETSAGCSGAGDLTFSFDCTSVSCGVGLYKNCNGSCGSLTPQACENQKVGLMLDEDMGT